MVQSSDLSHGSQTLLEARRQRARILLAVSEGRRGWRSVVRWRRVYGRGKTPSLTSGDCVSTSYLLFRVGEDGKELEWPLDAAPRSILPTLKYSAARGSREGGRVVSLWDTTAYLDKVVDLWAKIRRVNISDLVPCIKCSLRNVKAARLSWRWLRESGSSSRDSIPVIGTGCSYYRKAEIKQNYLHWSESWYVTRSGRVGK